MMVPAKKTSCGRFCATNICTTTKMYFGEDFFIDNAIRLYVMHDTILFKLQLLRVCNQFYSNLTSDQCAIHINFLS